MDDLIKKEILISKSKIRDVFTPFSPVNQRELLSGRNIEISNILGSLNTPGQHALIYGARGIGKSSLANVISKLAIDTFKYDVFTKKCSSDDSFTSILSEVLTAVGHDSRCVESVVEASEGTGVKLDLKLISADLAGNNKSTDRLAIGDQYSSPSWCANTLRNKKTLLIVDEADVIEKNEDKLKLAEFIKHLSDFKSNFKVLIVGISETGRDLVHNHKSIERCLNEVSLQPIAVNELRNIIKNGEAVINIKFDDNVIDDIADISGGYPHFVHLIALKCAEEALISNRQLVSQSNLAPALKLAAQFSEGNLRRSYEDAIKKQTENSRKILLSAALCHPRGFLIKELLEMKNQAVDPNIGDSVAKSFLTRWVKDGDNGIIIRVERGHYRFNDPRLISYIKMVNGFSYDKETIIADILRTEFSKRYATNI